MLAVRLTRSDSATMPSSFRDRRGRSGQRRPDGSYEVVHPLRKARAAWRIRPYMRFIDRDLRGLAGAVAAKRAGRAASCGP